MDEYGLTFFTRSLTYLADQATWFEQHPQHFLRWHENKINNHLEAIRRSIVASKHAKNTFPKPGLNNMTFINTKLTAEQIKDFDKWVSDQARVDTVMAEILHDGYKFSFQKMSGEDIYLANLYPGKEAVMNNGLSIGSRSTNFYRAVLMCAYKHAFLCDDNDWSQLIETSGEG